MKKLDFKNLIKIYVTFELLVKAYFCLYNDTE